MKTAHIGFDFCSSMSGGFGVTFNGGGGGGKKGRRITGDAGGNRPPAAKKPRTCGICHLPGHTRVTCPQRWQLPVVLHPHCETAPELCGVTASFFSNMQQLWFKYHKISYGPCIHSWGERAFMITVHFKLIVWTVSLLEEKEEGSTLRSWTALKSCRCL